MGFLFSGTHCISRSGHRFKVTTKFNDLHSSLRKMLYLKMSKIMKFVACKVLHENPYVRILWYTRYIGLCQDLVNTSIPEITAQVVQDKFVCSKVKEIILWQFQ